MKLFKNWRCEHDYEFVRNIYGDEINFRNGNRSEWKCKKCGKIEYRPHLHQTIMCQNLDKLYDEYYKDKYEEWLKLRSDTLNYMTTEMEEIAKEGRCSADFMLICEKEHNDKNYYEKWFRENKLQSELKLVGKERLEINQFACHVRWKYNY